MNQLTKRDYSDSALQVFLEPIECALPGELGIGLVVTGRGVVVETMIRTLVNVCAVSHVVGLQRLLVSRPSAGDARIQRRVVKQQRRLDLGGIRGGGLAAVEGNRSGQ